MTIETYKDSEGKEFVPVPVAQLIADVNLPASMFLKIDQKLIKYRAAGDSIDGEKINYFLEKSLSHFYIELSQLQAFIKWMKESKQERIDAKVEEVGEEFRATVEKSENIREKVFDTFSDMEINSKVVTILKDQVRDFVEHIQEEKIPAAVIAKMLTVGDSFVEHATNVANVSLFISMVLGHGNYEVLEAVYLGALFHDYGKIKVPKEILENKKNLKYQQAIQDHPQKGVAAIKKIEGINKDVLKIILQHHEQHSGNGYPNGLNQTEIFGLAKIVQVANIFDNSFSENKKGSEKDRYRAALKVLEYDRGKQFDPQLIEKILEAMSLAYGSYIKE